jgi:putative phosphoesterase
LKIAVLSDIHSNKFALLETLKFLENKAIDKYIFLGDYFGYYPWASESFSLIEKLFPKSIHILGNHDELIKTNKQPLLLPEYWDVIIQNRNQLSPFALNWLAGLSSQKRVKIENIDFVMYHGTPDDPLHGRFYPDDEREYNWFPEENEILLLGHTHYPILKKTKSNGFIVNPGSVGQPRDGNLNSSFCIIETENLCFDFFRIPYPVKEAIDELLKMDWYTRAIRSLSVPVK